MHRYPSIAASLAAFALALPAPVMLVAAAPAAAQASDCEAARSPGRRIGRSILGGALGAVAGRASRSLGYLTRFVRSAAVADTLTDAIACRLDEREQLKAKDATIEATRSEEIGATSSWTSESRENVSGTSTVVALDDAPSGQPSGSRCMLIDDVILVNGEETVQQKRMCRVPPSAQYALAA